MTIIFLIAGGITISLGLIIYLLLNKRETRNVFVSRESKLTPSTRKLIKLFGGDILELSSTNLNKKKRQDEISKLFVESRNPLNITIQEFIILKFILGAVGLLFGAVIFGLLYYLEGPLYLSIGVFGLLGIIGYNYPKALYTSKANERKSKFKSELPKAIDYLIMILSGGGYTLTVAFEKSLAYLEDGAIKEEFSQVVSEIKSGRTLEEALIDFADRSSSDDIRSFCRALISADNLSVSTIDILTAKAKEARKELMAELDRRVTSMASKIAILMVPTAVLPILIISIAPSVGVFLNF